MLIKTEDIFTQFLYYSKRFHLVCTNVLKILTYFLICLQLNVKIKNILFFNISIMKYYSTSRMRTSLVRKSGYLIQSLF